MTDTRSCITHDMRDANACFTDGHTADCEWDECEGCRPAEATHGHLCDSCWRALNSAEKRWGEFLGVLGGEVRAQSPDLNSATVHPGPRLPLSPMQLDIEEITALRGTTPDLGVWVATTTGATDAVRFTHKVAVCLAKHRTRDELKSLPVSRCEKCRQRSLVYQPPAAPGSKAVIRCMRCSHTMDEDTFERYAAIEAQCCRRCRGDECTNRACTCHTFTPIPEWQRTSKGTHEPFDPTRREHIGLDPLSVLLVAELRNRAEALEIPRYRQMRKAELIAALREADDNTNGDRA